MIPAHFRAISDVEATMAIDTRTATVPALVAIRCGLVAAIGDHLIALAARDAARANLVTARTEAEVALEEAATAPVTNREEATRLFRSAETRRTEAEVALKKAEAQASGRSRQLAGARAQLVEVERELGHRRMEDAEARRNADLAETLRGCGVDPRRAVKAAFTRGVLTAPAPAAPTVKVKTSAPPAKPALKIPSSGGIFSGATVRR